MMDVNESFAVFTTRFFQYRSRSTCTWHRDAQRRDPLGFRVPFVGVNGGSVQSFYHGNIRVVRIWCMYHIEGEQFISLQNETNVFDGLGITKLFFMAVAEFPLFAQNDRRLLFSFGIPSTEDDKLLIMIDE